MFLRATIGCAHPIKSDASTCSTNVWESPPLSLKASSMSASYSSGQKFELLRRVTTAHRLRFIPRNKLLQCLESYPFIEATLQELSREQQDLVSAKLSGASTPAPDDMIARLRKENEQRWVVFFFLCMAKFNSFYAVEVEKIMFQRITSLLSQMRCLSHSISLSSGCSEGVRARPLPGLRRADEEGIHTVILIYYSWSIQNNCFTYRM